MEGVVHIGAGPKNLTRRIVGIRVLVGLLLHACRCVSLVDRRLSCRSPVAIAGPPRNAEAPVCACSDADGVVEMLEDARTRARLPRFLLVGGGPFGRFLAKELLRQGYTVDVLLTAAHLAAHEAQRAAQEVPRARLFHCARAAAAADPDVVLLCTSIEATQGVLRSWESSGTLETLCAGRLIADVLSVKEVPRQLLDQLLRPEWACEIVCTHPMFGPVSARRGDGTEGWVRGLPLMYEIVRQRVASTGPSPSRKNSVVHAFISFWKAAGCEVICMNAEQHDREAAETQFITHAVGRTLALGLDLPASRIATSSYVRLRELVRLHFTDTNADSDALFTGLYRHNRFAAPQLARLRLSFDAISGMLEGCTTPCAHPVAAANPSPSNKCMQALLAGVVIGTAMTLTLSLVFTANSNSNANDMRKHVAAVIDRVGVREK